MASIPELHDQRGASTLARRFARELLAAPARSAGERYLRFSLPVQRCLAFALLVPSAPVLVLLMLLIRCTSPGAAIYRQVRVGRGGKNFTLYKLRTMRCDAERESGPVWASPNDPRVTRLGAVLRRLHLDELPQLWNVVRGDMALIGPRPERPEFTEMLVEQLPDYPQRWRMPPGITGLAQVNLPPDVDVAGVAEKLKLDLEYIRTARFGLDLSIVAYTVVKVLGLAPRVPRSWFGLDRRAPAEPKTSPPINPPHFLTSAAKASSTAPSVQSAPLDLGR